MTKEESLKQEKGKVLDDIMSFLKLKIEYDEIVSKLEGDSKHIITAQEMINGIEIATKLDSLGKSISIRKQKIKHILSNEGEKSPPEKKFTEEDKCVWFMLSDDPGNVHTNCGASPIAEEIGVKNKYCRFCGREIQFRIIREVDGYGIGKDVSQEEFNNPSQLRFPFDIVE